MSNYTAEPVDVLSAFSQHARSARRRFGVFRCVWIRLFGGRRSPCAGTCACRGVVPRNSRADAGRRCGRCVRAVALSFSEMPRGCARQDVLPPSSSGDGAFLMRHPARGRRRSSAPSNRRGSSACPAAKVQFTVQDCSKGSARLTRPAHALTGGEAAQSLRAEGRDLNHRFDRLNPVDGRSDGRREIERRRMRRRPSIRAPRHDRSGSSVGRAPPPPVAFHCRRRDPARHPTPFSLRTSCSNCPQAWLVVRSSRQSRASAPGPAERSILLILSEPRWPHGADAVHQPHRLPAL